MFSHVMVGVSDLEASRKFYDALLGTLGIGAGVANKARYFYRSPTGTFGITIPINGEPATHANGGTIGFTMASPEHGGRLPCGRRGQRRHHLRRPAGLARGRRGQALPGLPARPRRQQALRAVPAARQAGHPRLRCRAGRLPHNGRHAPVPCLEPWSHRPAAPPPLVGRRHVGDCAGRCGLHRPVRAAQRLAVAGEMQDKLATRFPRRYPVAGLAELNLQTPRLALLPERNRLNAVMAVEANGPALRRTHKGSLDVDFALRFEPADQTVRATELQVNALQFDGLSAQASTLLAGLGPTLAQQALREVVAYQVATPGTGVGRQPGPAARAHHRDAAGAGD